MEAHMYQGELSHAMKKLIILLGDYQKKAKKNITIIFDGKKEEGNNLKKEKVNSIKIEYSHDLSADYIIMQKVKNAREPKITTVITSDKEIQFFLNRFFTPYIKSEDFSQIVKNELQAIEGEIPEKDIDIKLSQEEVNFWQKMFTKK